jgi:CHAT domain-containing protein/Tfp pilus assembly protein PilF
LEELLREGRDLIKGGHPAEAEQRFKMLWQLAGQSKEYGLAARGIGNAGACQFATHRYQEAARSFIEAHRLAGIAGDRSGAALFESNLASLYSEMGELDAAVVWTEHSLRSVAGKDRSEHLAELQIQLGSLRARQGHLSESIGLFNQGIELAGRQRNLILYALGWNRLGEELMRRGDHAGAERAFLEAFQVRSLNHLPLAGSYLNLGKLRLDSGDLAAASALLDRALESSPQPQSVPALDVYRARGQVKLREGRLAEALDDLHVALRLERAWRGAAPSAEAARIGTEGVLSEVHGAFIEAGNRLYLQQGGDALIRETFEAAEENRANSLRMLISGGREIGENLPPSYWEAIARLQRAELAVLRENSPAAGAEVKTARAGVIRLDAETGPGTAGLPEDLLEKVERALDNDTALLSFHLGDSTSWLWAIDQSGLVLHPLPRRQEIEAQVEAASRAIREDSADARSAGARLHQTLFGPLTGRFHRKHRWLLALDMQLFDVPLAALADAPTGPLVYLTERHIIEVIPGAGAWLEAPRHEAARDSSLFVGIGDPIYNAADPRHIRRTLRFLSRWFGSAQAAAPSFSLPRLVASGPEIETCARSWAGDHVLLRGADVSRRKLSEQLARNPAVVHFATHFLEAPDRTAALIPLGLGGNNEAEVLPALEISHWRLHVGLVVLSGCHSAAGPALRGSGLLGLTRAWLIAGAGSVVASRWPIPDEDGALFRAFYSSLRADSPPSPAAALRAAQLEMLHSGGWRARPSYWGAYFVMGNE